MAAHLQHAALEHREQADRTGADDRNIGAFKLHSVVSGGLRRIVPQYHQLLAAQRKLRIGMAVVIGEFDFVDAGRQDLDDRSDLVADKPILWQITGKRYDVEQLDCAHRDHFST